MQGFRSQEELQGKYYRVCVQQVPLQMKRFGAKLKDRRTNVARDLTRHNDFWKYVHARPGAASGFAEHSALLASLPEERRCELAETICNGPWTEPHLFTKASLNGGCA